jgi:5-methylcytosine-specific restriction endonuclease McrA
MRKILSKNLPLRLDSQRYLELHRQVLERDGWRCQFCGSLQNLQVHHLKLRSQSGGDDEQNLITLCAACHARAHLRR